MARLALFGLSASAVLAGPPNRDDQLDLRLLDQAIHRAGKRGPVKMGDEWFPQARMRQYRDHLAAGTLGTRDEARGAFSVADSWPGGIVPYQFAGDITAQNQTRFEKACRVWEGVADVRFVPRTNETNFVHVINGDGNYSYVGMIGGSQDLSMTDWGYKFVICHELGHALGMIHEHQRPDRDTYITVHFDQVISGDESNFTRVKNAILRTDYDFDSVMHYDRFAFAKGSDPTMTPNAGYEAFLNLMGQTTHLSAGDQQSMAKTYHFGAPRIQTKKIYADRGANVEAPVVFSGQEAVITATGLPPGLEFDADREEVTGVPTEEGTFPAKFVAENAVGSDTETIGFHILAPITLPEAMGQPEADWQSTGEVTWTPQRISYNDDAGEAVAEAGTGEGRLERTISGPVQLTVRVRFNQGVPADSLAIELDGAAVETVTGDGSSTQQGVEVPAGLHTVSLVLNRSSEATSATAEAALVLPPDQVPAAPQNLTPANAATGVTVTPTLSASAFSDADAGDTHAASEWVVTEQGSGTVVFDSGPITAKKLTSLTVGELELATTYTWSVRYEDSRGEFGPYSAPTAFTTAAVDSPRAPLAPTNLAATLAGSKVHLAWHDGSSVETRFSIERRMKVGASYSKWTAVAKTAANVVTKSLKVDAGQSYEFRVRAENGAGHSGYSNVAPVAVPK